MLLLILVVSFQSVPNVSTKAAFRLRQHNSLATVILEPVPCIGDGLPADWRDELNGKLLLLRIDVTLI